MKSHRYLIPTLIAGALTLAAIAACERGTPVDPGLEQSAVTEVVPMASAAVDDVSESDVIYACYDPSGRVYRIKEPGLMDECKPPSHVPFEWNQQGPQGDPGPPGPAGADGVSGWEIVWVQVNVAAGTEEVRVAECPAGKKVTGGGYAAHNDLVIEESHPNVRSDCPPNWCGPGDPSTLGEAWWVKVTNPLGTTRLATVYAICATV